MAGDENSVVVKMGDVTGDCSASTPLGRRGLVVLKGEEGGGIMERAGECCRLDSTLGRMRLLRFLSRELATLPKPTSDAAGESALLGPDNTDERMLVSLSAPVSLSKCIE